MSLLPSSPDISSDSDPRVVGLDSEEADDLMAALSSETARRLLAEIHEEPGPPAELAERVDTSLQNAQYHLEKLEDAGAIEVAGTAYSEKGREMNVYGPADSPLVIFAGEKERESGLRAALSRLFGGVLALAAGALVIQELFGESVLGIGRDDAESEAEPTPTPESEPTATPEPEPTPTPAPGGDADAEAVGADTPAPETEPTPAPEPTPQPEPTPMPTSEEADPVGLLEAVLAAGLPPGLAFFLGGVTVLAVIVALTYVRARP